MAFLLSPIANEVQVNANGAPLSGGSIETYIAGTSTPAPTFTDISGAVAQTNPIILNILGLSPQVIWLDSNRVYKFIIKDSTGVVQRTVDNIAGISSSVPVQDQWVLFPGTPTFINATTFSLVGDQTPIFTPNRRTRTVNTAGVVYSSIATSTFSGGITTIVLVNDAPGVLDSGLSQVSYGLLSSVNGSIPSNIAQASYVNFTGNPTFTTTGTSPAFILTPSPAIASYVSGQRFRVKFHANGTGAPDYTLNVSGLGARIIISSNIANGFSAPIIVTGHFYDLQYDGASFIVLNPVNSVGAGELFWWMLPSTPANGLLCNGAAVSRSTYGRLFAAVGTFYGSGDGTTTFNVPGMSFDQTLNHTSSGNEGVSTPGQVISHNHIVKVNGVGNIGSNRQFVEAGGPTNAFTELFGVTNNIAFGVRARLCIRF